VLAKDVVKLVADADVLLAAVRGGRAKAVIEHPEVTEVFTTDITLAEVQEYSIQLAQKNDLSLEVVQLAAATIPVRVVERSVYQESIPEAKRRIARRDPDDVELLALALHLALPV